MRLRLPPPIGFDLKARSTVCTQCGAPMFGSLCERCGKLTPENEKVVLSGGHHHGGGSGGSGGNLLPSIQILGVYGEFSDTQDMDGVSSSFPLSVSSFPNPPASFAFNDGDFIAVFTSNSTVGDIHTCTWGATNLNFDGEWGHSQVGVPFITAYSLVIPNGSGGPTLRGITATMTNNPQPGAGSACMVVAKITGSSGFVTQNTNNATSGRTIDTLATSNTDAAANNPSLIVSVFTQVTTINASFLPTYAGSQLIAWGDSNGDIVGDHIVVGFKNKPAVGPPRETLTLNPAQSDFATYAGVLVALEYGK